MDAPVPRGDGAAPELLVGLDADDTLWHSEVHFELTQRRVRELLGPHLGEAIGAAGAATGPAVDFEERLLETERRNLGVFGYGVKGFALSLVETVIEVTGGRVAATDIGRILDWCKELLARPVELLDDVAEVTAELASRYRLVVITKGDLFHQEAKLASSGLGQHLAGVEVVSEKDPRDYARILDRYGVEPARFVMVGNSLRSDIVPVAELGGRGVHIPYHVTWAFEHAELPPELTERVVHLDRFAQLPAALEALERAPWPPTG
jgi:putative hydrolase of the HAD superfamily